MFLRFLLILVKIPLRSEEEIVAEPGGQTIISRRKQNISMLSNYYKNLS